MSTESAYETEETPVSTDKEDDPIQELEERFESLNERVHEVEGKLAAVNRLLADMDTEGDDEDHIVRKAMRAAENYQERGNRIETLERELAEHDALLTTVSGTAATKEEAWMRTVQFAKMHQDHPHYTTMSEEVNGDKGDWVMLDRTDIASATGKSKRQGQRYIEDWGENKAPCQWRDYTPGSPQTKGNDKKKLLYIDLEWVGE